MAFLRKSKKEKDIETPHVSQDEKEINVSHSQKEIIGVLLRPHITEKTAVAAQSRAYVFAVEDDVNKAQIKKAVESRYNVSVMNVRVLNTSGKHMRRGRQIGWRKGMKKAYATIAEGQTIEIQ